ncbi:dioxygenase family protein [Corynebacterium flavescens]
MSKFTTLFEGRPLDRPSEGIEDQGLSFDVLTVLSRRRILGVLGVGAGSMALAACAPASKTETAVSTSTTSSSTKAAEELVELNSETAGPYPGDGSNGPDVLEASGIERRDLTQSIDGNGSATGTPMKLTMNLIDISSDNSPLVGAAVYVWHCNGTGEYSMYSDGVTDQTWLRGVQITDSNGQVTFDSIVPGCYTGRWPHIHFEVFPSINNITDSTNSVLTSQIVVPEEVCSPVYEGADYVGSSENLARITLETDNVFSDGWEAQTPSTSGDIATGYVLGIDVPVDPTTKASPADAGMGGGPGGPGGPGGEGGPAGGPPPQGEIPNGAPLGDGSSA